MGSRMMSRNSQRPGMLMNTIGNNVNSSLDPNNQFGTGPTQSSTIGDPSDLYNRQINNGGGGPLASQLPYENGY
jgi:hypothetical protein